MPMHRAMSRRLCMQCVSPPLLSGKGGRGGNNSNLVGVHVRIKRRGVARHEEVDGTTATRRELAAHVRRDRKWGSLFDRKGRRIK